ncbi:MAG: F0F1 ATP synthase subunit alpha, partial [Ruminococcus sp.]|nr:F0F1 ATP synthase subunit alpha [Ruminococcus sp.]
MRDSDREFLKELVRLDVSQTDCSNTRKILETCGDVGDTLANPLVTHDEKRGIINKLFPESMHKFLLNVVRGGAIERLEEILDEYD